MANLAVNGREIWRRTGLEPQYRLDSSAASFSKSRLESCDLSSATRRPCRECRYVSSAKRRLNVRGDTLSTLHQNLWDIGEVGSFGRSVDPLFDCLFCAASSGFDGAGLGGRADAAAFSSASDSASSLRAYASFMVKSVGADASTCARRLI